MKLLILLLPLIFLSSCFSVNKLQDAKSLGRNTHEIGLMLSVQSIGESTTQDNFFSINNANNSDLELRYQYGVTEEVDLGLRLSISGVLFDSKFQLIGNKKSYFAASTGLSFGTGRNSGFQFEVPVFMSIYPKDNLALTMTPRFFYINAPETTAPRNQALGGSASILFGKKFRFGLEVTYLQFDRLSNRFLKNNWSASLGTALRF